jgi:hypothetical protein
MIARWDPDKFDATVEGWIALQKQELNSEAYNQLFWAFEAVYDLVARYPEAAVRFIVAVLEKDSSDIVIGNLSAGPLEDLLAAHGAAIIDRIESEARENALFARLANGVWRNQIDPHVWKRIIQLRGQKS